MEIDNPKEKKDKILMENYFQTILKNNARPYERSSSKVVSIPTQIDNQEEREKKIKNDGLEQDIQLKKNTLSILFNFLAWETIAIFVIAFLQGFKLKDFLLEEWSFRILLVSTILQITAMLTFAVQHLFPKRD